MKDIRLTIRSGLACVMAAAMGILATGCGTTNEPRFAEFPGEVGSPVADSQSGQNRRPTPADPVTGGIRFQINDTVVVKLSGNQFQTTHEEKVKEDGTITLPHIGSIRAANRTGGELQKEIYDLYVPNFYRTLTVVVSSPDQFFYVGGEVRVNNRQPYIGTTTVLKAIQSAGGFTDWANERRVRIIRGNGETLTVDCVRARRDPSRDVPIYPGDQIHVPRRWI